LLAPHTQTVPMSILDPCVGPATFPKVLVRRSHQSLLTFTLTDIDPRWVDHTRQWCHQTHLSATVSCIDYLSTPLTQSFDRVIMNPPYVRQEWIDRKETYQRFFQDYYHLRIPGTSNLYVYFVVKSVMELKPDGVLVGILYDSWQSTLFGRWLQGFLQVHCRDMLVIPVKDQPFASRLIDATIIKVSKRATPLSSSPGSFVPSVQVPTFHPPGFAAMEDVFHPRRGLRLKQAKFFLCRYEDFKVAGATPFVKKIGRVQGYRVPRNHEEGALLCSYPDEYPRIVEELYRRLEQARQHPEAYISVLTWVAARPMDWYVHMKPTPSSIIFNYYLRNRPRHLYNPNRAYSDNFYGVSLPARVSPLAAVATLNATIVCKSILDRAHNQGNGLAKIQLFDYRLVSVPDLRSLGDQELTQLSELGAKLITMREDFAWVVNEIDNLFYALYPYPELNPEHLANETKATT